MDMLLCAGIDFANHANGGSSVLSLRQLAQGKRYMLRSTLGS